MTTRIPVAVYAADQVLRTGVTHQLKPRPEVEVLPPGEEHRARVALVVVDEVDEPSARLLRRLQRATTVRTGVVVSRFDQDALQVVVDCGVVAVVRRGDADQDRLVAAVSALAKGEAVLPGDLLGKLLDHVSRLRRSVLDPNAPSLSTLTPREADMLRLVSEGFGTAEIAVKMSFSERTVKNVLHEVTTRLNLRNRAHAVGYVMRHGLI
ncbi:response regulator transcription factor [Actinosynnema pretiosum subsp. pretiosum]|uniref:Transcriptional regulator, LuxR family n=2 Tax=Actinosynnema TaxID=40566 RepID=C6WRK9_ACTMD|nr:LuxR C-terminal-related transcriptional regulator [Actinosynnema mirum]ACU36851.1 transcriptional regulator, LuxR family [Actinosynnema mirum DSM 43827]QUF05524.1 response regulator transcription factor [Actinosynnema pretiosum subsp. pretiosum]